MGSSKENQRWPAGDEQKPKSRPLGEHPRQVSGKPTTGLGRSKIQEKLTRGSLMDARDTTVGLILWIRTFSRGLYFRETSHVRSFVKIKPPQNGKITFSFIDIDES